MQPSSRKCTREMLSVRTLHPSLRTQIQVLPRKGAAIKMSAFSNFLRAGSALDGAAWMLVSTVCHLMNCLGTRSGVCRVITPRQWIGCRSQFEISKLSPARLAKLSMLSTADAVQKLAGMQGIAEAVTCWLPLQGFLCRASKSP